jgi:hypothetical protein
VIAYLVRGGGGHQLVRELGLVMRLLRVVDVIGGFEREDLRVTVSQSIARRASNTTKTDLLIGIFVLRGSLVQPSEHFRESEERVKKGKKL